MQNADRPQQANAFSPQWGQVIFQSANEINQNRILKERIAELQEKTEAEKAWWEKKRAGMQIDIGAETGEKDVDAKAAQQTSTPKKTSSDDDAVMVEAGGPGSAQGGGKKKGKGGKK